MTIRPLSGTRPLVAAAAVVSFLLAACGGGGGGDSKERGAPGARDTKAASASQPATASYGTYAIGRITETFVDSSRPTDARGFFPGSSDRTLVTAIWYPAAGEGAGGLVDMQPVEGAPPLTKDSPYPLILFSHGATAFAQVYENVIEKWVSAGYVVAAPDYPLSNANAPGGVTLGSAVADVANQPADASFVIDQVLAREDELLDGIVDPERVGASGHSLGGITTFGLAYADCCDDERVDAAIPMSGIAALMEDGAKYFQGEPTPLLILHGDADPLVPYASGTDAFGKARAPKFFVTFTGAGHIQPFLGGDDAQATILFDTSLAFWDRYLKSDDGALRRLRDAVDPTAATLQEQAAA